MLDYHRIYWYPSTMVIYQVGSWSSPISSSLKNTLLPGVLLHDELSWWFPWRRKRGWHRFRTNFMMSFFFSRWVPFKLSKHQLDKQVTTWQRHQDTPPKSIWISSYIFWLNLSNLFCQFYPNLINLILQYVTLVLPVCHFWCLGFLN